MLELAVRYAVPRHIDIGINARAPACSVRCFKRNRGPMRPSNSTVPPITARGLVIAVCLLLAMMSMAPLPRAGAAGTPVTGTRISVPGGSYRALTPPELTTLLKHKNFLLVNVHFPYAGELPHTDRFLPYNTIGQHLSALPADKRAMIVLYCRSGRMSDIAARTLVRLGYVHVWHLAGGMDAWQGQGFHLLFKARP
jgi:rhodanese-related sulfurtransferase